MLDKVSKKSKKNVVEISLKIGFLIMVLIWLGEHLSLFDKISLKSHWAGFMGIISFLFIFSGMFTFVISITYLVKHKEKVFAVISLVISSILIILFIVGLIVGAIENSYYKNGDVEEYLEEYIDFSCQNFCTGIENVKNHYYKHDEITDVVMCYCLDSNEEVINQKTILLENLE